MAKQRPCVLIVEDDPIIQALVHQALGGSGYDTLTAGSGRAMFDVLEQDKDRVDLILLDLGLPDGDALPHIVKVRELTSVPVIVVTGRERIDDRLMALGLGADDYMTKPIDVRELVLRVGNIISRRGDGPAPTGAPIVVDGNRIKNPPKSQPAEKPKKSSSSSSALVGVLVLIGIAIGGAGAFWLTLDEPLTEPNAPVAAFDQPTAAPTAPEQPAQQPQTVEPQPPAPAPQSAPSVAETVVVTEQTNTGGSRSVITAQPEIASPAAQPDTATGSQDVLNTQTRARALGYQWVLDSACARIPQVDWWRYKTHADMAEFVVRRHEGAWEPFIDDLIRRLAKMYDIAERGSAALTPGGDRMEGEVLEQYIQDSVNRLEVARCLAEEAKQAGAG